MKAMVLHEFGKALSLRDVAIPKVGPDEALVKVAVCAPDRFDTRIKAGGTPGVQLPLILGHEIAGEVVEVGREVTNVKPGERVIIYTYFTCGFCRFCKIGRESLCTSFRGIIGVHFDGGYAEYVKATAQNLLRIPDGMAYEDAAMATNCVITSYHALKRRGQLEPVDDVLIVGGGGGVGIHGVQVAKALGARRVIAVDVFEDKLEKAKSVGADHVILNTGRDPFDEEVMRFTGGRGVDVAIELVGLDETLEATYRSMATAGRMVIIAGYAGPGFTVHPRKLQGQEVILTGSRAASRFELADSLELVRLGRVKPVVTARFPLEETDRALELELANKIVGRAVIAMQ